VTYNRHPLYTFVRDTNKGQTLGEGVDAFGGKWYAVAASGRKVERKGSGMSTSPSSGGYGGSGGGW
jgi:hypothetical protein